jgi:predicted negative regulator of RcsB-dependent stress response
MSTYDLEEQEQLATLKAWWKQYGGVILAFITLACVILAVWTGWNWHQRNQSAKAAALYEQMQKISRGADLKATKDAAGIILEDYPRTSYAAMAALISAKAHFQAGDLKTARAQLEWVIANARAGELKAVARLRLASVLVDDNQALEATRLLEAKAEEGFEGLYAAGRGDAFVAQKKYVEAKTAYKSALEAKKLDQGMRELVQIKLDALGDS